MLAGPHTTHGLFDLRCSTFSNTRSITAARIRVSRLSEEHETRRGRPTDFRRNLVPPSTREHSALPARQECLDWLDASECGVDIKTSECVDGAHAEQIRLHHWEAATAICGCCAMSELGFDQDLRSCVIKKPIGECRVQLGPSLHDSRHICRRFAMPELKDGCGHVAPATLRNRLTLIGLLA